MDRKPDDSAIAAFIDELARQPWLGADRAHWPFFLFHITDVRNAARILTTGRVFCRSLAVEKGLMATDNASPPIIGHTPGAVQNHVRLYFRPRTPTFYRNEGIRPIGQRELGAHCPVPVAFVFDSKHVLGMAETRFSNGGFGRLNLPDIGTDVTFLRQMPFHLIYHQSPLTPDERDEIVHRRHAEVIVPRELPLDGLRHVYARSPAERETLISLLSSEQDRAVDARVYASPIPIQVASRGRFFVKLWSYVEQVVATDDYVSIRFNPDSKTPGPFTLTILFEALDGSERLSPTIPRFVASQPMALPIPPLFKRRPFRLSLILDDSLAYQNEFDPVRDEALLTEDL